MEGKGRCGQCGGEASLRCGGCSAVHYCSKDHQRQHWSAHKAQCWPFTLTTDPGTGRHLVASRSLQEGQLVVREAPVVLGPTADSFPICLGCHCPIMEDGFPRCPRCSWPLCSLECAAAPLHQAECAVLATDTKGVAVPPGYIKTPRYDVILVLRCLLLQETNPEAWKKVRAMESHAEKRRQENEPHTEIAVTYFTKVLDGGWDEETVRHVHGAIITNAINTYGARREALRGLYTTLYLMNHSCCPNVTIRSDPDGTVYARAAVSIKKGEPLLFSYLPPSDPLWRRQGDLTSLYYFRCSCERCTDHTELGTYFSSPLCPQCSGGFLEPYEGGGRPWSCPECGEEKPEEEVVRQAEEYVQRIQKDSTNMEAALQMLTDAANTFHTNHFVWLTAAQMVLHHLQDTTTPRTLSVRRDLWQRIIGLYQRLEPGATRRKGVSLFNAAMVEKEAAELQMATLEEKVPSKALEQGLNRAVTMLDASIKILELEPPASTELRWLEAARKMREHVFDLIATNSGDAVSQ
ncbi:SET domain-containing protein SmydA-8-like [Portunus trituberculatus]|uniref:Protein msta, isoform A n=1 Tax=Portunus trituberculatus TaxID=210409 RepID=A0A5B7ECK0_PORTR|nr:SET domain-containing protein SmydA-8-like [Portunus trituberculatus]MPC31881.1 Protein msta, isoform A [Portunus trituberculatus]